MAGIAGAGSNGAGLGGANTGPLSAFACRQYAALASMRWQMFKNGLRSNMGMFEFGARAFSYFIYGMIGLGMSVGLGFGAYFMMSPSGGKPEYLPILFWAVFMVWQMLPVALASFQEQFDLGILLRFPLGFISYVLLYLIFGLVDISTIAGGLCCLGLWVGTTVARPDLSVLAAVALCVFAGFNILLVRAIFAWIDRWLAQRRTREIVGAIFLLAILSLQLLNPALRRTRHTASLSRADRAAEQQRTADEYLPWLKKANVVQKWLPAGLAAQSVQLGAAGEIETSLDSLGLLAMYALAVGVVLIVRLSSEYAGESLGEAPGRSKSTAGRHSEGWAPVRSGAIAAVMEKELRAFLRTLPMLYALGAPLLLILVFSGVFIRSGPPGHQFALALPACLIYVQLGFTQIFYNSLGAEGTGIQLYFLSPTPMRTVLLAKNLFHSILFGIVGITAGILASLRLGIPELVVVAASVAWLLFALPCNLAAGNIFSLTMAYRVNPGRMTKQRGSQANNLLSVLVQLGVLGVGASVFSLCWLTDEKWLAVPGFLVLAGVAVLIWRSTLKNADAQANRHKEELIAKLAKTA